ncbi:MAG: hypothetical protein O4861_01240 [Trichodesmium sp. St16_bin4-tuft]|nr:hypothetical protein [Trichodesmium sp. St4_bin8_1]MDE5072998.1 hypothetical protein [Trichodesmium sp. St5_bin8]MDE5091979.1 hypothetical protein [Trichodesmium sp. St18_bin3_1_1]MDE5097035.1 hypothetical protein [Trichodesmium sp. St16_bin4-tuft]MDE5102279.1 hypothetical protein [Trichodesmium sp. St19_bin2]
MESSIIFLTPEELAQVDAALLTSKDKFSTRLAIYSLRCLREIARETGLTLEEIPAEQVKAWMQKDKSLKQNLDSDPDFESFFTRLVMASLYPLKQVAQESAIALQDLTVQQVVKWFEKKGKIQ